MLPERGCARVSECVVIAPCARQEALPSALLSAPAAGPDIRCRAPGAARSPECWYRHITCRKRSTSGRSRAGCRDRSSSLATRAPATPDRHQARRHRWRERSDDAVNSAPQASANMITGLRASGDSCLRRRRRQHGSRSAHRAPRRTSPSIRHVGGKLLRPGQVKRGERDIDPIGRNAQPGEAVARCGPSSRAPPIAGAVTVHDGDECDQGGGGSDQDADDPLFESIEDAGRAGSSNGPSAPRYSSPLPLVGEGSGVGVGEWAPSEHNPPTPHPTLPHKGEGGKKRHTRCNCLAPARRRII